LADKTPRLHKGKALSIADGEGRNSVWLASQGFVVDAFDFSPIAIEKAKKLAAKHIDLQTYLQDVDEGPGHSGMSSLVGFIGQKLRIKSQQSVA
jgi:2-polyprenyl-3-methyl-5-hydroxy-6-metoxy-1,4-benzoquinol methylase